MKHCFFTNDVWLGQKRERLPDSEPGILIPSPYMFHAVIQELCTVRFAVGGLTVELNFLCVFTQCAHGSVQIWWCQWAW